MPRYKLTIEYDGTPFLGWQAQAEGATVQGAILFALGRLVPHAVRLEAAGRTDTGVHATGQVAHVDIEAPWRTDKLRDALNFHLKPAPIAILQAEAVPSDFSARFSATRRHYRYRLLARRAPAVLDRKRVWWVPRALDVAAMQDAARFVVGHHDFTTFRAAGCQSKSPEKTLDVFDVALVGTEVHVTAVARSFMHNQVRSMVGSLKLVGDGKWRPEDMKAALEARDRSRCGGLAPPWGLCLIGVSYPGSEHQAQAAIAAQGITDL